MIKNFKYFLAVYIPVFVIAGVLLRNSAWLKPIGYIFSGITLGVIGYIVYEIKFKKK